MKQNRIFFYIKDLIACTFSNSEHARTYAKRNAVLQIIVATAAFILMMRVFPMGLVQNHVLSRQNAYENPSKGRAVWHCRQEATDGILYTRSSVPGHAVYGLYAASKENQ